MATQLFAVTQKDKQRLGKIVRKSELHSTPQEYTTARMYQIPNLPYPMGGKFSFGVTFPSSIYDVGYNAMSTMLALAAGPVVLPHIGLSLFPSASCFIPHISTYNHIFNYYNSSSDWGISYILADVENVSPSTFPSNYINWLYTIKMEKKWVDSVIPRVNSTAAVPEDNATFRCVQTASNKVMVYAGTIRHHGLGHWNTVDTEITLGDSEYRWIFVNFYRDTLWNPTIEQQVEEPISDTSTIRIPLSYWRQTSPGSFTLVKTTHKYDVQMGNPLV